MHGARVLRKIIGGSHTMHFCNTTILTADNANGRYPIDELHMKELVHRMKEYHLIII